MLHLRLVFSIPILADKRRVSLRLARYREWIQQTGGEWLNPLDRVIGNQSNNLGPGAMQPFPINGVTPTSG